jgi:glyoxylase-like metal-dependent hydrolase (beta-lactamase superfamily II)
VNERESEGVKQISGLSDNDLVKHHAGDELLIGNLIVRLLHTPGHTPGSQCFLAGSALVSGDTLFIGGCGRVDLPGGNADQLYDSLTQVLAKLPEDTLLYPGHNYSEREVSTIGDEKKENYYMTIGSLEDWRRLMHVG